jgi:hypothetical protein
MSDSGDLTWIRLRGRTCPSWGPGISGKTLWNPDKELDKVGGT